MILAWSISLQYAGLAAGLAACAIIDGLFCGMETGMYVLNKVRLDLRAESGSRSAKTLRRMLRNTNNLLAVLLIGTNIARYLATFCIASMFVLAGLGDDAQWYTMAVATPFLFVVTDSVPKVVFHRMAEQFTYRFAWLLRAADIVFTATGLSPLVRLSSWILIRLTGAAKGEASSEKIAPVASIVAEGHAAGVLTHFQSVMADRIMRIADVRLADIMMPLTKAVTAEVNVTRERLIDLMRESDFSRLPLLDSTASVAGIVDIYNILAVDQDTQPCRHMTPPLLLEGDLHVNETLYRMQKARVGMAIVLDAAGHHVGMITTKDLLEEIVGELQAW